MNITTPLKAKHYLDQSAHKYSDIFDNAAVADNQFIIVELAKRYQIDGYKLANSPDSVEALLSYMIDIGYEIGCDMSLHDKLAVIDNAFGSKRTIPIVVHTTVSGSRINIEEFSLDIIREICEHLGWKDIVSLKVASRVIFEMLIGPQNVDIFRMIVCANSGTSLSSKIHLSVSVFRKLYRTYAINPTMRNIIRSVHIDVSHIYMLSQLNDSRSLVVDFMKFLAQECPDVILSIIPIPANVKNAAVISFLVLISTQYNRMPELIKLLYEDGTIDDKLIAIVSEVSIGFRRPADIIAHAWKKAGLSANVDDPDDLLDCDGCWICEYIGRKTT